MIYVVILVLVLMIGILLGIIIADSLRKKIPAYLKKMPEGKHDKEFIIAITRAYSTTGNIKGMLLLLKSNCMKRHSVVRVTAALDYLEHSRHQDYETALSYLSDKSEDCEQVLEDILAQEIRKRMALEMKY